MHQSIMMLFGQITEPSFLAKMMPDKEAVWGNHLRQWRTAEVGACARGGILSSTKILT